MRQSDIDVDTARDSGALTLHTAQDTYCRMGVRPGRDGRVSLRQNRAGP